MVKNVLMAVALLTAFMLAQWFFSNMPVKNEDSKTKTIDLLLFPW
jgi:hypothetical protein